MSNIYLKVIEESDLMVAPMLLLAQINEKEAYACDEKPVLR